MLSLPSWECGLKLICEIVSRLETKVTPFVGVWIEIPLGADRHRTAPVTPFVGVWIEISVLFDLRHCRIVTPFVGVWIEIIKELYKKFFLTSLPSWECGLKSAEEKLPEEGTGVTPFVGVWIEIHQSKPADK